MKNIKDCPSEHNSESKVKMLKQVQHDDETELYKKLGELTKNKAAWENSISDVAALLEYDSTKIQAKALWLLGEMGLQHPEKIGKWVPAISDFLNSPVPLLRERALNALGRIGRADFSLIKAYWNDLFRFAKDEAPNVRLNFIWASENIATNTPDIYEDYMGIFAELLADPDDKVRMEAPEIFRVLGKRKPELAAPYIDLLSKISENDSNRVVRIHSKGAIKAFQKATC
ncbi:sister chromatid cohesion protein PDS5 [Treponema bryantii]|uniref:sister chromatid cohesion protein PDS5 n=1 Tax=Treponema bryantii TaxID=163 RepID=UPI0003B3FDB9|nr:sister chromatid cohesion protein PDS5 [Treponema bryantii]